MQDRHLVEDALKHIHECQYTKATASVNSLAGGLSIGSAQASALVAELEAMGLVTLSEGGHCALTEDGRNYALQVIRAHRLYETYLARETGLSAKTWHRQAEIEEHTLSKSELDRIAQRLGDPRYDPHGDPIPTRQGHLPPQQGKSLLGVAAGWEGRIVHVEDEPEALYADLVAKGLAPGLRIRVLASDASVVRINAEGRTMDLSRSHAALLRVAEFEGEDRFDESIVRLSMLHRGEKAAVVGLAPTCVGPERYRLLDLGVVPGTVINIELVSPSGNPIAYAIRGASIALRTGQAERILVRKLKEGDACPSQA